MAEPERRVVSTELRAKGSRGADGSYLQQLPENAEVRNRLNVVEFRADEDGRPVVAGHASTFNDPYDLFPGLREQVAPEAFDDVLKDDVVALVNHNIDRIIARSTSEKRRLRLAVDKRGLLSEFPIPDHMDDVVSDLRDGVLRHMSFAFTVAEDSWERGQDGEPDLRTIEKVERLWDVSIVANPANPNADVALRSLEAARSGVSPPAGARLTAPQRRGVRKAEHFIREQQLATVERRLRAARRAAPELPPPGRFGSEVRGTMQHECAHAVVAHELGHRVRHIVLWYRDGRPTGDGRCRLRNSPKDPAILLAGLAAEALAAGRARMVGHAWRAFVEERVQARDDDVIRAQRLTDAGHGPRGFKDMRYAWSYTCEILQRRWADVERLVDVLAATPGGRLEGAEIHRILAPQHGIGRRQ